MSQEKRPIFLCRERKGEKSNYLQKHLHLQSCNIVWIETERLFGIAVSLSSVIERRNFNIFHFPRNKAFTTDFNFNLIYLMDWFTRIARQVWIAWLASRKGGGRIFVGNRILNSNDSTVQQCTVQWISFCPLYVFYKLSISESAYISDPTGRAKRSQFPFLAQWNCNG